MSLFSRLGCYSVTVLRSTWSTCMFYTIVENLHLNFVPLYCKKSLLFKRTKQTELSLRKESARSIFLYIDKLHLRPIIEYIIIIRRVKLYIHLIWFRLY